LLKLAALLNVASKDVTEDVSHLLRFLLKLPAPENVFFKVVTALTSQSAIHLLKLVA
jgi:hypothetical protein